MLAAMTGPLALVGGDELKPGNEPQDELLVAAAGDGPAFVLATAAARQRPDLAVRNATRWFARLGLRVEELPVLRRGEANSHAVAARAAEGRFFYLVGGDPGITVRTLAGTKVWEAIAGAWRNGASLAGSSAGAMALGQWSLIRSSFPSTSHRRFLAALGVVPRTAVIPHFERFGPRWAPSTRSNAPEGAVLLGVDERTAAVWDGSRWMAMGPASVTVAGEGVKRRFRSGQPIQGVPAPG
jgi:cyanophycinase